MALIYISAGSNQGNRAEYLRMAAQLLAPAVKILRTSELYLTEPWGYKPQPSFYNLVWEAETDLDPDSLLKHFKEIEKRIGRVKTLRYGPRVIDLDILLYDDKVYQSQNLTIPHAMMRERRFVLQPLCDLIPMEQDPVTKKTWFELLQACPEGGFEKLNETLNYDQPLINWGLRTYTMGIVNLRKKAENGETVDTYSFTMATAADEISAKLVSGDLDIALIPANLASVLYHKTQGKIRVADINTLGVLYCVTTDESIHSVEDLTGKTVVTTGQGTTPEYALRTLLERSGITDCTLEFKSEATEVAALLKEGSAQIGVLPQPFVTAAMMQNEALQSAFSLSEEWDRLDADSHLVTGVTVVRAEFLEEHADAVARFVSEHEASAALANSDVQKTAELVAEYGIIEKAPVAAKALPNCNIVCITGEEMKTALSGYLDTLYAQNPQAVGGSLPGDDFYVQER